MPTVLLTGAETALGRRVRARLGSNGVVFRSLDVGRPLVDGADDEPVGAADVAVHLGAGDTNVLVPRRGASLDGTSALLAQLDEAGVTHLVVLSSAMVYGAWPNNPVPLTEDAPLRPDPAFGFASRLATAEQLVEEWRLAHPARTVTVLRPALTLAADGTASIVRALAAGMGQRFGQDDAPAQFLHLDDLAQAVEIAVHERLDGVFNVAPDGWISGERLRALSGERPRLPLPPRVVEVIGALRWRFQRGPLPPYLRPYTWHPWLVANDRLKRAGWRPTVTNEQAYVEGTEAKWWTMLTPKRKQELALTGMVAGTLAVLAIAVAVVRVVRRATRAARSG
jgi:nucleoside-diphosphate-sugar epimerase